MNTDATLKQNVLDELSWNTDVDVAQIGVAVSDGSVTLLGHVPSYSVKYAALSAAKQVRGVKVVADEIAVNLPTSQRTDDSDIAERIAHVMTWNVSIPEEDVKARVRDGAVTLTGEVDWHRQRQHIESQIRHVGGVKSIINLVKLKQRVTPDTVKDEIEDALKRNAELEAGRIKVYVTGHKVTLEGNVTAYYEKELVENAAWAAPGVSEVVDHLRIV